MKFNIHEHESNYTGTIVKITNLEKVIGLDNLVKTVIFGSDVLVGIDTAVGDIGVFFPSETVLSDEFLSKNNLYRHSELNVNKEKKGFFEDSKRVKSIRFRGVISTGFWIPLNSLSFFCDIDDLNVNDSFQDIDGQNICRKYRRKQGVGTQKNNKLKEFKLTDLVDERAMPEHYDTENLFRNMHKLDLNDIISCTVKIHGCLTSKAAITMEDGSKRHLTNVNVGDSILGFDEDTRQIVSAKVLNKFITGKTEDWLRFKIKQRVKGADSVLTCTKNHDVFTSDGWKPARDINIFDMLGVEVFGFELTELQKSIIIGKVLGDGSIYRSRGLTRAFTFSHKTAHKEYLDFCIASLGNIMMGTTRKYVSGYGTDMLVTRSKQDYGLGQFLSDWVFNGKKGVNPSFKLDKYSLAFWYMDDGSLAHSELQVDRAHFAICRYDDEQAVIILQKLKDFGFTSPKLYKQSGYNRIRLNRDDAELLFTSIADVVPPVMQYKLPIKHRNKFIGVEPQNAKYKANLIFSEIIDKSVIKGSDIGYKTKLDLETTTGNFFANKVLVHNSSLRVSRNIVYKPSLADKLLPKVSGKDKLLEFLWDIKVLPQVHKFIYFLSERVTNVKRKFNMKEFSYEYIAASRRVIKSIGFNELNGKQHFYGNADVWTTAAKLFEGKLHKGENIYAELIGFTDEGAEIQKDYSYGVPHGTFDIYIYRISRTNEDGVSQDLPYPLLKQRCAELGMKVVPLVFYGELIDFIQKYTSEIVDERNYLHLLETVVKDNFLDKPSIFNCKEWQNIEEGIVIVKEQLGTFYGLKAKSPIFLSKESANNDKGVVDLEEDEISLLANNEEYA